MSSTFRLSNATGGHPAARGLPFTSGERPPYPTARYSSAGAFPAHAPLTATTRYSGYARHPGGMGALAMLPAAVRMLFCVCMMCSACAAP